MDASGDSFELKLGRMGNDRAPSLSRVRAAVRKASPIGRKQKGRIAPLSGLRAHFLRGAIGKPKMASASLRQVTVKARYFVHGASKGAPLRAHIAYLERKAKQAGKAPSEALAAEPGLGGQSDVSAQERGADRAKSPFYDRSNIGLDAKGLPSAWLDNRWHFRVIVSPEDGAALGELRPFIRELMDNLGYKLGTRLEWLAVDHWDTDNPHSHVLIRGRRADGSDLFIPPRIFFHGIREHAQAIVTRVLGPRLDIDLAQELARDVGMRNISSLDRELLLARDSDGLLRSQRPDLNARLARLESWDLAEHANGAWRLDENLVAKLKAIAAYDDIQQMVSKLRRPGELSPLLAAELDAPMFGELVHVGPRDELSDSFLAIITTGQGELRYAKFNAADDLAWLDDIVPGGIVAFEPALPRVRLSDEDGARIAERDAGRDLAGRPWKETSRSHSGVPDDTESGDFSGAAPPQRLGMGEHRTDGIFAEGPDPLDLALGSGERTARPDPLAFRVASYWTLGEQIEALGPTHLDHVLAREAVSPGGEGVFARKYAQALQQRRLFLIDQGWMGKDEQVLSKFRLQEMATFELRDMAQRLSQELGKPIIASAVSRVEGVYARRIDLAQGRMALILGERSGHLLPWRPPLERFAGREVRGVMRGASLSWGLSGGLGMGLSPI